MTRATVREARPADVDAVVSFTGDTWGDRSDDYVPRVLPEWVAADDDARRTFVATLAGDDAALPEDDATLVTGDGTGAAAPGDPEAVVGCIRGVTLSEWEAWVQGIRVHPAARGLGVGSRLTEAVLEWARTTGATVCRNMVFSWNVAGLGQSRAAGFEPTTEFRFAHPEPASDPGRDAAATAVVPDPDPDAAWAFWQRSDARAHLDGLALDPTESWACSEVTRERLAAAAAEDRLLAVADGGIAGVAVHTRVTEYESISDDAGNDAGFDGDRDADRTAVYGVAAWRDAAAAGALYDAIGRDAAGRDATATRVLVPETVEHVSDTASNRVAVAAEPDFVTSADLTDPAVAGD
ncbi:Acetyltransferase (GNAT) family protein [Halorubrum aquaticum]|uniref:Acetyltransferase (GNAT) family protein n=1 Tax=Halorubrum aquaticum TaxID=387340 RepID=A0A1I3C0F8_9EURY|nr:GNAT family N-acetyltransferase [Halorubrum aquaticum]SFH68055.1 Acetyltransferase (GNAT) family protein [Halorubrum aquaticum]